MTSVQLLLADDGGEPLGGLDPELFVHVHATEDDFYVANLDAELFGEETDHVVGGASGEGNGCHAYAELMALYLADGVTVGVGGAEYVEHQGVAFPGVKWFLHSEGPLEP